MAPNVSYAAVVEQATGSPMMGTEVWHLVTDQTQAQRIACRRLGFNFLAPIEPGDEYRHGNPNGQYLAGVDLAVYPDRARSIEDSHALGRDWTLSHAGFRVTIPADVR